MTLVLLIILGGSSILGLILGVRWAEARAWRRQLVVYRLHPALSLIHISEPTRPY